MNGLGFFTIRGQAYILAMYKEIVDYFVQFDPRNIEILIETDNEKGISKLRNNCLFI